MQQLILTKGLPASGKSTWAKDQVKNAGGSWKRINRDDLRAMVDAGEWSPEHEKFIITLRNVMVESALRKGHNVVVDDTNLKSDNFTELCDIAERLNIDVMVLEKCFPIDIDTAIARDKERPGTACVGEKVIMNMWKKYLKGHPEVMRPRVEHFHKRESFALDQDESLPKAIICDLDGTLAIIGDRSPFNAAKCDLVDLPNKPVIEAVRGFYNMGYKVIFVSGREDKDRDPTMRFIAQHLPELCSDWFHNNVERLKNAYQRLGTSQAKAYERGLLELEVAEVAEKLVKIPMGAPNCRLLMRTTDDKRKDTIVKKEIFDREIKGKYNVLAVIDDRPSVCRMWRYDIGLLVFQVHDKEF